MKPKIIALADCNSFFVSCEKLFRPSLEGKPVVVLSNNDACVVSRSAEAKAIGIKMQAMGSEVKRYVESHELAIFSSNPELYRDMSRRVMAVLSNFCPTLEVYSIDEAFLDLTAFQKYNFRNYGKEMQQRIKQWTGIPVSIGLAPTKTLAKIANHEAKMDVATGGVVDWTTVLDWDPILAKVKVGAVWGIGHRTAEKLEKLGINTALDLKQSNPDWIRQQFNVVLLRTLLELGGTSCLPVQSSSDPKQALTVSRCFGRPVVELAEMKEAIATYTSKLAEKLRQEGLATKTITISMRTNRYASIPQYQASQEVILNTPTNLTQVMLPEVLRATEMIFKPGYEYYKAQVYASDLIDATMMQHGLFESSSEAGQRLMKTVDNLNQKLGAGSVRFGAVGLEQGWKTRVGYPSKQFTTRWSDLPLVKV